MKNAYVTALTSSILSGQVVDKALANTKELLVKRGHERLWSQILRASSRVLTAKLKQQSAEVSIAREGSVDQALLRKALTELGTAEAEYRTIIDPTLIGGFTARFKGNLIDQSYKRSLVDLYRKITK